MTNDEEVGLKLTRALNVAKGSWDKADLPDHDGCSDNTANIAIALLAVKIFGLLEPEA